MAKSSKLQEIDRTVRLTGIGEFSDRLNKLTQELREQILAPKPRKNPPEYSSTQVASMCGIDRQRLNYLIGKGDLPGGKGQGSGKSRVFTLKEARDWVRAEAGITQRPASAQGKVLICANFKGGSTKTTTSMCLAQGLSLRGRKVLVIDLDPQASLTELCGVYAEKEVTEDETVLPFIYDPGTEKLADVVQPTYWDGIDVIVSHPQLFGAEFQIPAMIKADSTFKFWTLLRQGLEPLRHEYDYIILDSAPSLSYLTINALMAADAIVMPLVPESLDFISSVSFWSLFSDLTENFIERGEDKEYDFVSVLLSKVDYGAASSAPIVRSWANRAYGDWLETIEIPASSVMSNGALAVSTVFDIGKWDGDRRTLGRIREPLEAYCKWIDDHYVGVWQKEQDISEERIGRTA